MYATGIFLWQVPAGAGRCEVVLGYMLFCVHIGDIGCHNTYWSAFKLSVITILGSKACCQCVVASVNYLHYMPSSGLR